MAPMSTIHCCQGCCIYHGVKNRGKFQHLMNQLRSIIPDKLKSKIGKKICCRFQHSNEIEHNLGNLNSKEISTTIKGNGTEMDAWNNIVEQLSQPVGIASQSPDESHKPEDLSGFDMTQVPASCKQNLETWLRDPNCCNAEILCNIISSISSGSYKTFPSIKKKVGDKINLPLPSAYVGFLFGRKGRNIKEMYKKFGFRMKTLSKPAISTDDGITFEIFCKDFDKLDEIKRTLVDKCKILCKTRKTAELKTAKYWMTKMNRSMSYHHGLYSQVEQHSAKEVAKENFGKKYFNSLKFKHQKQKGPPVLKNSHCMHCHCLFNETDKTDVNCKYHSGFLESIEIPDKSVLFRWSCCQVESKPSAEKQQDHILSGCRTGLHLWRPYRKTGGKETRKKGSSQLGYRDELESMVDELQLI